LAQILIIGYGNPLRSDDGFGWHAAQKLATLLPESSFEVLVRQQLTPDLAESASHFALVIFVDAAVDLTPGELRTEKITRLSDNEQSDTHSLSHSVTPGTLLGWTGELYAKFPDAYCLSVGGEGFGEGESLSPIMTAAFTSLLQQIKSLTAAYIS
jgi:hydrogenase maturation protease